LQVIGKSQPANADNRKLVPPPVRISRRYQFSDIASIIFLQRPEAVLIIIYDAKAARTADFPENSQQEPLARKEDDITVDMDFERGLEPRIGDSKMNQNDKPTDLVDTTDCLEAISVFRGWKNFLFIIVVGCLLSLQGLFWVVDLGLTKTDSQARPAAQTDQALAQKTQQENLPGEDIKIEVPADVNRIEQAAKQVAAEEPNVPGPLEKQKPTLPSAIKYKHIAWLIRFLDFVLIIAAMLYCLTMLFSLLISLLGRLGGINHVSRAFFLSLVFLMLLLPWQKLFGPVVKGAMYTPAELAAWANWSGDDSTGIFAAVLYYLRFTGYWLLMLLLLIFSMARSVRWAKATLRRLEVM